MNDKRINFLMLEKFPEFSTLYHDTVDWQEGDETSIFTTFSFVIAVALLEMVENGNKDKVKEVFSFLDSIVPLHEDSEEAIAVCVLEHLLFSGVDLRRLYPLMSDNMIKLSEPFYNWKGC